MEGLALFTTGELTRVAEFWRFRETTCAVCNDGWRLAFTGSVASQFGFTVGCCPGSDSWLKVVFVEAIDMRFAPAEKTDEARDEPCVEDATDMRGA
jgi:hypothetical protein